MGNILRRAWARFPCCSDLVMVVPGCAGWVERNVQTFNYLAALDLRAHSTPAGKVLQGPLEVARPLPQQFCRISRRHRQVRSPKSLQDCEIHADHFPVAIEQRPARAPGGGRSVVNNLVLKNIADMTLGRGWTYQLLCG